MINGNTDAGSEASSLASAASEGSVCVLFHRGVSAPGMVSAGEQWVSEAGVPPGFLCFPFCLCCVLENRLADAWLGYAASWVRSSSPLHQKPFSLLVSLSGTFTRAFIGIVFWVYAGFSQVKVHLLSESSRYTCSWLCIDGSGLPERSYVVYNVLFSSS